MYEEMVELAKNMGVRLSLEVIPLFERYAALLLQENKNKNLTRITEPREIMIKHFLDSLALLAAGGCPQGPLLDVGSGAGMPGIPLKIACPGLQLTMLDAQKKRAAFLMLAAERLALSATKVLHRRAEDAARLTAYREAFPVVVSRAVAPLNTLVELCLPFVAVGGFFVAYKGPEGENEAQKARPAMTELGCDAYDVLVYQLPEKKGERTLLLLKKNRPTPEKYPRKAGLPAKRPL